MNRIFFISLLILSACSMQYDNSISKTFKLSKDYKFQLSDLENNEIEAYQEIPEVKQELKKYLTKYQKTLESGLVNRDQYAFVADIFEEQGVPLWLSSLGVVESGFKPQAVSPAGAKGIWQFTKPTAKSYGLKVNWTNDQRVDPEKSTKAVALHLSDLYRKYKDWNLVLAAYNAGSGKVNNVLKSSDSKDFWSLARDGKFSKQTKEFVPKVLAVALISSKPENYGF